ncbi:MAG: DUF4258 domain-containing protein, partial [archaeon]|nr:DUF4258 domain-containing protein [archaeon]
YAYHAESQLQERKIDRAVVEDAIKNPDRIIPSRDNTIIAQKEGDGRLLRVVYKKEEDTHIIITAYYTNPHRYTEKKP